MSECEAAVPQDYIDKRCPVCSWIEGTRLIGIGYAAGAVRCWNCGRRWLTDQHGLIELGPEVKA